MPATYEKLTITHEFLNKDPNAFFVYGDNLQKQGTYGSAALRTHPRAIGFATRKGPPGSSAVCFKPEEYSKVFFDVLKQLSTHIRKNPAHKFYISKLGAGSANKHYIWEKLIHHNLTGELQEYDNVVFCWESEKLA